MHFEETEPKVVGRYKKKSGGICENSNSVSIDNEPLDDVNLCFSRETVLRGNST
jgi:hypothetical protein